MPELSARLEAECGVEAQPASLSRFLCRRGFTYKKTVHRGFWWLKLAGGTAESLFISAR